jgi:uroporphyrin-III C-methyltransferase
MVHLVGAGPGDPELLTIKAKRLLEQADAVVYDALVDPKVLEWARPGCERIFAGKRRGRAQLRQEEIDATLVRLSREGKAVVRLKGGDPLVFGRAGEEAGALASGGIPFAIVPGVTAALGAAAAAGIALSHRSLSSAIVLLTGHEDPTKALPAVRWEDYARSGATLCVYMGMHNLPAIAARLLGSGLSPQTPVAVVQGATTAQQRILRAPLDAVAEQARGFGLESPALVVIGAVADPAAALAVIPTPAAP